MLSGSQVRGLFMPLVASLALAVGCQSAPSTQTPAGSSTDGQPKYGGVIRTVVNEDNRFGWDPQGPQAAQATQTLALSLMFNTLVSRANGTDMAGDDWTPQPDLAERWDQPDDKTVIFHLRQGVKFHNKPPVNGRELTAEDVKWSFERLMKSGNQFRGTYDDVANVEVRDKYTIAFQLKAPSASFLVRMSRGLLLVAPKEAAGPPRTEGWALPEEFREPAIIGTGPFMFEKHDRDSKLTLKRNPDYFKKGLPYADSFEYVVARDPSAQMALMTSGQIDFLTIPVGNAKQFMENNPGLPYAQNVPANMSTLQMRTDRPPYNDVRVRRALMMAIDQEAIIATYAGSRANAFYGGLSKTSFPQWFLPPEQLGASRQYWEYNPTEAKRLLTEAGYPNGFSTTFRVSTCCLATYLPELIADLFGKIGVQTQIEVVEHAVHQRTSDRGEYDHMAHSTLQIAGDPDDMLDTYVPGHVKNVMHVDDPKLTKMIQDQKGIVDQKQRKAAIDEISKYLAEQAYVFRYPARYADDAWQPYLKGYRPHPIGTQGRDIERSWIDK